MPCGQRYICPIKRGITSFREECLNCNWNNYDDNSTIYISRPEQSQVVEWLRINHGIWVDVGWKLIENSEDGKVQWWSMVSKIGKYSEQPEFNAFNSPQEAYSAAFDHIIESEIISK